jgi:hypothetical protein
VRNARTLLVLGGAAALGLACRGSEKVGDKRGYACAEVSTKDDRAEIELGGAKLVRVGPRGELAVGPGAAIAVASLEGGPPLDLDRVKPPPEVAIAFLVGLGGLPRAALVEILRALSQAAPIVVVPGPRDEPEVVRAAAKEFPRVIDGTVLRALVATTGEGATGIEIVTMPGADDPASLSDHGRGCVLREIDARTLAGRLGPPARGRPRIVVSYGSPARTSSTAGPPTGTEQGKTALDAFHLPPPDPSADDHRGIAGWIVAGPVDTDAVDALVLADGASAPRIPMPRLGTPRTTSAPAVVPPGWLLLDAREGAVGMRSTSASIASD